MSLIGEKGKKYGLLMPTKQKEVKPVAKPAALFANDEDEEDDEKFVSSISCIVFCHTTPPPVLQVDYSKFDMRKEAIKAKIKSEVCDCVNKNTRLFIFIDFVLFLSTKSSCVQRSPKIRMCSSMTNFTMTCRQNARKKKTR